MKNKTKKTIYKTSSYENVIGKLYKLQNGGKNELFNTNNSATATAEWSDIDKSQELANNQAYKNAMKLNNNDVSNFINTQLFPINNNNYSLAMPKYIWEKYRFHNKNKSSGNNYLKSSTDIDSNIETSCLVATNDGLFYSLNTNVFYLTELQPNASGKSTYSNGIEFSGCAVSTSYGVATTKNQTSSSSTIYLSTSVSGNFWQETTINNFDPSNCEFTCCTISDNSYILAGTSNGGGIYVYSEISSDQSDASGNNSFIFDLASLSSDLINSGYEWSDFYINNISNYLNYGIAGTNNGLLYSTDYGQTWSQVSSTDIPTDVDIIATTLNNELSALCATTTSIYYSTNTLTNWTLSDISGNIQGDFNSVSVYDGYGLACTTEMTFQTSNYGINWIEYDPSNNINYNYSNSFAQLNGMGIACQIDTSFNNSPVSIQTALITDSSSNIYTWTTYDLSANAVYDISCLYKELNCQECDCGTDCTTYNTTNISSVSNNSTQCSYNLCQGYTIQVPDSTSVNLLCTCDVSGCDTCNPVDGLGYDTCCTGTTDAEAPYVALYNQYMVYNTVNNPGALFYSNNAGNTWKPSTVNGLTSDDLSGNVGPLGMYNNIVFWLYQNTYLYISSDYGETYNLLITFSDYGIDNPVQGLSVWGTYFFVTYVNTQSGADQVKVAYGNVFPQGKLNYFKISSTLLSGNSVTYNSGQSVSFSTHLTTNNHGYLITNDDSETFYSYKSINNGETWEEFLPQSDPSTGTNFELGITGWTSDYVLLSQSSGVDSLDIPFISYTNNSGSTWSTSQLSSSYILTNASYFTGVQQNNNFAVCSIVVDTNQATILFSENYGYSFKQSYDASFNPMTFYNILSISISGKYAIAGVQTDESSYTIYISENYGYTWYLSGDVPKIVPAIPETTPGLGDVLQTSNNGAGFPITNLNQITAINYEATSDYRIKTNIFDIDDSFSLQKLKPVIYFNKLNKKKDIGLIAHELAEIYPFLVNGEKDGNEYQSVNYIGLISILVKNVQLLKQRLNTNTEHLTFKTKQNVADVIDFKQSANKTFYNNKKNGFDCSKPGLGNVLENSGDASAYSITNVSTVQAASFSATSDYRIKKNVQPLNKKHCVDKLNPVSYFNKRTRTNELGFLAHEVKQILPFVVLGEKDDTEYQSINYNSIIPILIKEIQEIENTITNYEDKHKIQFNYNHTLVNRDEHKQINDYYSTETINKNTDNTDPSCNLYTLAECLEVNNDGAAYSMENIGSLSATTFTATSDYRIKKDVKPLDESYTIDKIKPVIYYNKKIKKQDTGFIAHELQEQYEYLVTGKKDQPKLQTVKYNGLIALLTYEIKNLKQKVNKKYIN